MCVWEVIGGIKKEESDRVDSILCLLQKVESIFELLELDEDVRSEILQMENAQVRERGRGLPALSPLAMLSRFALTSERACGLERVARLFEGRGKKSKRMSGDFSHFSIRPRDYSFTFIFGRYDKSSI